MKRTLEIGLSPTQINEVINELKDYKERILPMRIEELTKRLAERSIEIAESYLNSVDSLGNVVPLVEFKKEFESSDGNSTVVIIASDKREIARTWLYYGTPKTEWVSPTLMAEFGSGQYAIGGHRGTFPRNDGREPSRGTENAWHYKGLNGQWYSFNGIKPTQPMYHAIQDLYMEVNSIAKEVF